MASPAPGTRWVDVLAAWARLRDWTNKYWPSYRSRVHAQRNRLG